MDLNRNIKIAATGTSYVGLSIPPHYKYNIGNNRPENLLDFVVILQEELVRAEVLSPDYDFEAHKELVPIQPGRCARDMRRHHSLGTGFRLQAFHPVEGGIEDVCGVVYKMRKVTKTNENHEDCVLHTNILTGF